jgi:uncharacterized protein YecE (DUF72 family)
MEWPEGFEAERHLRRDRVPPSFPELGNSEDLIRQCEIVAGPIVYVRFHGSSTLYAGPYSQEELAAWAEMIRAFLSAGRELQEMIKQEG